MKLRAILNRVFEATIGPWIKRRLEEDAKKNSDLFSLGQHSQGLLDYLGNAEKEAEFCLKLIQRENLSGETLDGIETFLRIYGNIETTYKSACKMIKENPERLGASQSMVDDSWRRYNAFYNSLYDAVQEAQAERKGAVR